MDIQFTPIGKRSSNGFEVLHSYPSDDRINYQRNLIHPLKDTTNNYFDNDDSTKESINEYIPKKYNRSPIKEINIQNTGLGVKESENIIQTLRGELLSWKLKYKELFKSLEQFNGDKELLVENADLKKQLIILEERIRQSSTDDKRHHIDKLQMEIKKLEDIISELRNENKSQLTDIHELLDQSELDKQDINELRMNLQQKNQESNSSEVQKLEDLLIDEKRNADDLLKQIEEIKLVKEQSSQKDKRTIDQLNTIIEDMKKTQSISNNSQIHKLERQSELDKAKIDDLKQSIIDLEQQLQGLLKESKNDNKLIHDLRSQISKKNSHIDSLTTKLSSLELQLDSIISNQDFNTNHKIQQLTDQLNNEKQRVNELNRKLESAYKEREDTYEAKYHKDHLLEEQKQTINKLKSELEIEVQHSNNLKVKINNLTTKKFEKEELESHFISLENENETLRKDLKKSDVYCENLLEENTEMKADIKTLIKENENSKLQMQSTIEKLEHDIIDLEDENRLLRSAKQQPGNDTLYEDNVELVKKVRSMQRILGELGISDELELTQFEKELKRVISTMKNEVKEGDSVINQLKKDLSHAHNEREMLIEDLKTIQDENNLLSSDMRVIRNENKSLNSDLKSALDTIKELQNELANSQDNRLLNQENLKKDLKSLEQENNELKRQIKLLENEKSNLEKDLSFSQEQFKKIEQNEGESPIQAYHDFQLNQARSDYNKLMEDYKKAMVDHDSKVVNLKEEHLYKIKKLQDKLNVSNEELLKANGDIKMLTDQIWKIKSKIHGGNDSSNRVRFLRDESNYFRIRYKDTSLKKNDFEFLYNFAINQIKLSPLPIDDDSKLIKVGIYPNYNKGTVKTKPPTFKTIAQFVLAAVRLKNRADFGKSKFLHVEKIKNKLDFARSKYKEYINA
ncbi:hypothetical protein KGF54_002445 [Candida jiufengensis]|uniref:uncharacterized protein n=1 Tax=Candida jiufengensis TaxID=497108 RepID=UPI002224775C|nr:uncharacterized protein KGF54_002445 [Candida jiufengensis]KAI5954669.1 hypothetical protein KGF54_002445 [Candida jiufengensis]